MRASLDDASLTRYAGRFVWLELDFDKPSNQPFIARRHVAATPTIYVLDPADERATATHLGGMTLAELDRFLAQGERGFQAKAMSPADSALAIGNERLGRGQLPEAAAAFQAALALAPPGWPGRTDALGSFTWSLMTAGEAQACAETAAVEAPRLPRDAGFARVVLAGMMASLQAGDAPWAKATKEVLEPLAVEAVKLPSALRDHRFQLYDALVRSAQARSDTLAERQWSLRWLDEIDAITPRDDNERSALDIARVDAVVDTRDLPRIITALEASVHAMPTNYNASLRLAQALSAAGKYDQAIGACDQGLLHVTGPVGRCWLQRTRADALRDHGDMAGARAWYEKAQASAREIGNANNRENNLQTLTRRLAALDSPAK